MKYGTLVCSQTDLSFHSYQIEWCFDKVSQKNIIANFFYIIHSVIITYMHIAQQNITFSIIWLNFHLVICRFRGTSFVPIQRKFWKVVQNYDSKYNHITSHRQYIVFLYSYELCYNTLLLSRKSLFLVTSSPAGTLRAWKILVIS